MASTESTERRRLCLRWDFRGKGKTKKGRAYSKLRYVKYNKRSVEEVNKQSKETAVHGDVWVGFGRTMERMSGKEIEKS